MRTNLSAGTIADNDEFPSDFGHGGGWWMRRDGGCAPLGNVVVGLAMRLLSSGSIPHRSVRANKAGAIHHRLGTATVTIGSALPA